MANITNLEKSVNGVKITYDDGSISYDYDIKKATAWPGQNKIILRDSQGNTYDVDYANENLNKQGTSTAQELAEYWDSNFFF